VHEFKNEFADLRESYSMYSRRGCVWAAADEVVEAPKNPIVLVRGFPKGKGDEKGELN